ncbi:transposon Ty3-I Gag-Pol polyprotein-like protein [Aphelenchoides avenae]|nr:transposon Ty3-I Gag-Pol polyprotein-like protein [Aphelenchus avenae]
MMVLQVFVEGIRSEGSRATLLQKEKLKPQEALELAQVHEMAENEAHDTAATPVTARKAAASAMRRAIAAIRRDIKKVCRNRQAGKAEDGEGELKPWSTKALRNRYMENWQSGHRVIRRRFKGSRSEEIFHMLNGGKKFTKLDLRNAYLQAPLDEESRKLCTLITHKGLFQRLEEVLKRLKAAGLRLKKEKCEFLKKELKLLGRVFSAEGVKADPDKVTAIVNMPAPLNVKELESFLGMVNYHAKFMPHLATMTAPLNALRRKEKKWIWTKIHTDAVEGIKKALVAAEVLAHYDPKEEVVLATDASDYGLGGIVFHRYKDKSELMIACASRTLNAAERNYGQIEKEALGIVETTSLL